MLIDRYTLAEEGVHTDAICIMYKSNIYGQQREF